MFMISLAGLSVGIEARYPEIETVCRPYRTDEKDCDFSVCVTEEALAYERAKTDGRFSDSYLETLAVYRMIGEQLPHWNAFIFHAATIEADGKAYAFTAKSGTGKTTHITHWKRAFGEHILPINGDKPIFRLKDGVFHAYGTPWAGKERIQRNACAPLAGLCFLRRGEANRIRPLDAKSALQKSFSQIYLPQENAAAEKTLQLLDILLREVPLWDLECTDSTEAAFIAKNAMTDSAV